LCLGFDFDFPSRVEEAGDYHHRGDGARSLKKFAVDGTHGRGVVSAGEEHAGADDVVEGRSASPSASAMIAKHRRACLIWARAT